MPVEIIVIVAAVIVSWLVFTAFVNIVKTSIKTALTIAAIALILQIAFGIRSDQIAEQIIALPRMIWQFFTQ
ncbi:hypothetical protein [[Limnothrix rosea] IAM M-220]|uniref:hypothetical protein n=1 Tax=[Limnothrix rosea] IAM M-220 TaxID=454133 RepID=UPI000967EA47|nr:hypothetical protein [[Limnothrix rosea] IAM M-220]OKH19803.1 hypothetical protein NIES208_01375 [[Limnothrix rosea] IAM M-220]